MQLKFELAEIGVKIEGLPLSDHYKINFHMIA